MAWKIAKMIIEDVKNEQAVSLDPRWYRVASSELETDFHQIWEVRFAPTKG